MLYNLFNTERFIHSIKTVIACLIGIFLTKIIGYPADQWIVVTIIVVMCAQIYVGSVFQRAYLRFLGTLAGCLFAIITIVSFGVSFPTILITICLSSFIFSYLATANENLIYTGTLGAVTTAIILMGHDPSLSFALQRFLEISTGILIAMLVSQFVIPINARTHLQRTQANTLTLLRDYYSACLGKEKKSDPHGFYEEVEEDIIKTLYKQRQLAKEARRELFGKPYDPVHFMQTLYCEREILRSIDFMHNALFHCKYLDDILQSDALQSFNKGILETLNQLIETISSTKIKSKNFNLPDLTELKNIIHQQSLEADSEERIYLNGFLFSAEFLLHSLKKLANNLGVEVN